jgi:AcrR family transcriptional regulator
MTLRDTILQEALIIIHRNGLAGISETSMMQQLDISQATFREIFSNLDDLVNQVIKFDAEQQKAEHKQLLAKSQNAVEDIMLLLQHGIKQVQKVNPILYQQLQESYPAAWQIGQEHLHSYSYPQVHGIINKGVLEGNFRKDVNIQLVTKIIMEQLMMMLNPLVFPPSRYNLAEVFRSIYLYYLRGICTDKGGKLAEEFFARTNL